MSTIKGFFPLSLSPAFNFLPEENVVGFRSFAWGLKSEKNKICVKKIVVFEKPLTYDAGAGLRLFGIRTTNVLEAEFINLLDHCSKV